MIFILKILMTDTDLKELVTSLAVAQAQMQSQQAQMQSQFATIQAQFATTQAQMQSQLQAKMNELAASHAETEALLRKTIKDNDKRYKELSKQIGGLGNKFGSFTEGMAFSSMNKLLRKQFGMEVIATRVKASHQNKKLELDLLAYTNGDLNTAFIVEIKSHIQQEDLQQLLTILATFPEVFPEHADKRLYGILAAVDIPDNVMNKVLKKGIYLAMINDELFKLRVPTDFQARSFSHSEFEQESRLV